MFTSTTAILLAAVAFNAASTLAVAVPTGAKSVAPQTSGAAKHSEPKLMATGHVHDHHHWKQLLKEAAAGKPIVVTTFGKNNVPNGAHNVTSEQQWEAILKAADGGPIVISTFGATPVPAQVSTTNGTAHAHAINGTTSGTPPAASLVSLASAYGTKATATAASSAKASGTASVTSSVVASATSTASSKLATKGKRDFEEEFYAREFSDDMEAREFYDDEDILAREFYDDEDVLAREFYDDEDILAREFEDDMEARDYEGELAARLNFVNKTPVFHNRIARDYEEAEFYGREYESMEDLE